MEQKLKERVVGATLLVLAGVVFIPWLLDGRGDEPGVTQPLELPPAPAGSAQTRTIVLDAVQPATSTRPVVSQEPSPLPAPRRAPIPPATSEPPPKDQPASAQRTTAAAPPVTRPVVGADAMGWAVQVGSFSSQSNAQRLAERLETLGYKAFVSRKVVEDRVMYRVRVGPEISRDAATGLAERLRVDKQPVSVVEHPG